MPKVDYLRSVDVFKGLTQEETEKLAKGLTMRECGPRTVFFTPEDPSERLFMFNAGHVELYRLTVGRKRLRTRRLGPGAIFGEMGLWGQTMQGEFAEATEKTLVCTTTCEDVKRFVGGHPDVALRCWRSLATDWSALGGMP